MKFESKYNLDDVVYYIEKEYYITCPMCKGTGTILFSGEVLGCPKCNGSRKVITNTCSYNVVKGIITGIRLPYIRGKHRKQKESSYELDNVFTTPPKDEKDLFSTEEEAQASIKLNRG